MKCWRYTKRYKKYYPVTQVPIILLKKSKLINIAEVPWSPFPAHHSNLTSTLKWNYYPELGVYHSHTFLHTLLYTLVPQWDIYRYTKRDSFWRTGSCKYRDREVPRPAICKLEALESCWCCSGPNQKAWEPGEPMVPLSPSLKAWEPGTLMSRTGEGRCPSSSRQSKFSFPPLFVLFRPSTDWMMPTHFGEDASLFSPLIQILVSSGNTLIITFYQLSEHSQSSWYMKLTIMRYLVVLHVS